MEIETMLTVGIRMEFELSTVLERAGDEAINVLIQVWVILPRAYKQGRRQGNSSASNQIYECRADGSGG